MYDWCLLLLLLLLVYTESQLEQISDVTGDSKQEARAVPTSALSASCALPVRAGADPYVTYR